MLQRTRNVSAKLIRRRYISTNAPHSKGLGRTQLATGFVLVGTGAALWATLSARNVHNDQVTLTAKSSKSSKLPDLDNSETLHTLVWGANRNKTLVPDATSEESIRSPATASWLENVALRDLAIHQGHAACVDARGDLYQWGASFDAESGDKPLRTLKGKNIVQVQVTENKVYALSSSGNIYALTAKKLSEELTPGSSPASSAAWAGTGWLWAKEDASNYVEVIPREHMGWNEKFTSISAGDDHLLALTSKGRTYAHPVGKRANKYGQLGFRKVELNNNSPDAKDSTVPVDLIPSTVADPFAKSTSLSRTKLGNAAEQLQAFDDSSLGFCRRIFEVPAMRGVDIKQLVAGSRTSFALTSTGRVLGWGANEYGQVGLGNNVAIASVLVPTEVIMWRGTSRVSQSKCLSISAGGDLTSFIVEREDPMSEKTVDVLICGNGQWGGLGNSKFANVQPTPGKARVVSGMTEFSDKHNKLIALPPKHIVISPSGHVLLTLDSNASTNRDVYSWGRNYDSELGNGKKSSLSTPEPVNLPGGDRLLLKQRKAKKVFDLHGLVWGKNIPVQQAVALGYNSSVVYWRVC